MSAATSEPRLRLAARLLLVVAMCVAGAAHFFFPADYAAMVPPPLPAALCVLVSGICEIAGGLGLLLPSLRRAASLGLILLFIAVFPANLYMALRDVPVRGVHMPPIAAWGRLPLQALFIAWAWWVGKRPISS